MVLWCRPPKHVPVGTICFSLILCLLKIMIFFFCIFFSSLFYHILLFILLSSKISADPTKLFSVFFRGAYSIYIFNSLKKKNLNSSCRVWFHTLFYFESLLLLLMIFFIFSHFIFPSFKLGWKHFTFVTEFHLWFQNHDQSKNGW